MNYREKFEDEGFIYELTIQPTVEEHLLTSALGEGYYCEWEITGKDSRFTRQLAVTDDDCQTIVYHSIEAAVKGARDFLSI